ncbi:MAG: small, acid-soluble spore protein, alpha/beta type [Eubacteriales bacterium]|nr:small, acid-soluble spore protein, alpha/beta type [Eubacteriales bacterium]MDD3882520.1 small, acid-soluble spore protein, alpha/beta type [Eubacteriales bacterium]MDD4512820.1 small, acid-soluble spore protein, alpha/beta type [Eubacteriales bacterium]
MGNKRPRQPEISFRIKYDVAREEDLLRRVAEVGWAGLTPAESGRIGGIVSQRMRKQKP